MYNADFHAGGVCVCGKWLQLKAIITVQRSGQCEIEGFLRMLGCWHAAANAALWASASE